MLAEAPLPQDSPIRGISDGSALVLDGSRVLAAATIARARASGARIVRVPMSWRAVERLGAPTEPANPGDPAYDFAIWDDLVRRIVRAGLEPLITVYEAPERPEASPRWRFAAPGTWAPDPAAFGRFAAAVATRYSGHYPDPLSPSHALPHVRWWQAWNEPNLPRLLQPQWVVRNGRWHTYAPQRYRAMLNAFWEAIKGVDRHDKVLTAGAGPIGEPRDGEGRMAPVRFWQALLCLGSAPHLRVERCPDPAHFDLLAHHPLSIGDPTVRSVGPLDVAIADLDRVSRLLRSAQRHGLVRPRAGQRLAVTELNWDSRPPDPRGVSGDLAARYVAAAFFLLWRQGAALVLWQLMRDPVPAPGARLHPGRALPHGPLATRSIPATIAPSPRCARSACRLSRGDATLKAWTSGVWFAFPECGTPRFNAAVADIGGRSPTWQSTARFGIFRSSTARPRRRTTRQFHGHQRRMAHRHQAELLPRPQGRQLATTKRHASHGKPARVAGSVAQGGDDGDLDP